MEIEKKYLIERIPFDLEQYERQELVQGYISFNPVIRLRAIGDRCVLCVKSKGNLAREEFEMDISPSQFEELWKKTEGFTIEKSRFIIPIGDGLVAELDIFKGMFAPLMTVEVEFKSVELADSFVPPSWFGKDLTYDPKYKNSNLAEKGLE